MTKKIVDIFSPKRLERKGTTLKYEKENLRTPKRELKTFNVHFPKGILLFLVILFLIIALFSFSSQFSKAEIKIWPQTEELKFNEKLIVDAKLDTIEVKNKIIPGKIFESEETFSEKFLATGKILKKAQGTIRLFNEYTTQDEVWSVGTRFVSSEGKLFKSKEKIIVPGAKIENGKIKASYVDVPVEAAEGGADYNIGPSEFSILAFKGTPKYFKYYGKSFEPMRGGGEFPVVKKENLEDAEKSLLDLAKNKASEILKNKIQENFIILEDAFLVEVLDKNTTAKEGDEVEEFIFQTKLKIKTIIFTKENLLNFARDYIISQLPKGKEAYFQSLKFNPKTEVFNFELGKITLSLEVSLKTYPILDVIYLKKGLAGKSLTEARTFLLHHPEFLKVQIDVLPFWVKKVPENINQIEIHYPLID